MNTVTKISKMYQTKILYNILANQLIICILSYYTILAINYVILSKHIAKIILLQVHIFYF